PILDAGPCAEEEHGRLLTFCTQPLHERKAVELREHDVDDRRVVLRRLREKKSRLTVGGMIDGIARLLESPDQEAGDLGVIFDNEQTHGTEDGGPRTEDGGRKTEDGEA